MSVPAMRANFFCEGKGTHPRRALGYIETTAGFEHSSDRRSMSASKRVYHWEAASSGQPEDAASGRRLARRVTDEGRARFNCPRCPLDEKWGPDVVQRAGARVAALLHGEDGVLFLDLSLHASTLRKK